MNVTARPMLARHAEELFWAGRYLERAEHTARVIDVTYHAALEAGSGRSSEDIWGDLSEVLSVDDEDLSTDVGQALILDRDSTASIRRLITVARENARSTREWLSSEVWETLNDLHLTMNRADLADVSHGRPYALLRAVKTGCQTVSGAALSSMPRSAGYRFYRAGVMLERAQSTARVVAVWHRRLAASEHRDTFTEWQKFLRTVSALEAFLRAHRAAFDASPVLAFLLQSPTFPRSVHYSLRVVNEELTAVATADVGREARHAVGRVRADVEYCDPGEMTDDELTEHLASVEARIWEAAVAIEESFFRTGTDTDGDAADQTATQES